MQSFDMVRVIPIRKMFPPKLTFGEDLRMQKMQEGFQKGCKGIRREVGHEGYQLDGSPC